MNPILAALVEAGIISQADAERVERQLDPDAARSYAESLLGQAFQRGLTQQQRRILDLLDTTEGNPTPRQLERLWQGENELLWASVSDEIAQIAIDQAVKASIGTVDADTWRLVNENVLAWTDDYYLSADAGNFGSIPNLNLTSKTQFASAFRDWQRGELETAGYNEGLPTLIRALEQTFGVARSQAIGITETTRIFSYAEIAAGEANPFVEAWLYNSANDSLVTEFCRSGNGRIMRKGQTTFSDGMGPPPRHVRCRSSVTQLTGPALAALIEDGVITE